MTKKLLDQLKVKPETSRDEDPLFSWHANLITVHRRKVIVLVNDSNRYIIVLYGLLAKDFRQLDSLIIEPIQATLKREGIRDEIIERFIQHSPEFTYTKTKTPKTVARMNKSIESVYPHLNLLDPQTIIQPELNMMASRFLVGHGTKNFINPNQELYNDFGKWDGNSAIQMEAIQVKVTLSLENYIFGVG